MGSECVVPFIVALYVAYKNLHITLFIHKYNLFKEYVLSPRCEDSSHKNHSGMFCELSEPGEAYYSPNTVPGVDKNRQMVALKNSMWVRFIYLMLLYNVIKILYAKLL